MFASSERIWAIAVDSFHGADLRFGGEIGNQQMNVFAVEQGRVPEPEADRWRDMQSDLPSQIGEIGKDMVDRKDQTGVERNNRVRNCRRRSPDPAPAGLFRIGNRGRACLGKLLMLASVQAAANRDICRASTAVGSSPSRGSGAGPIASGLKRGLSVTGLTTMGSPAQKVPRGGYSIVLRLDVLRQRPFIACMHLRVDRVGDSIQAGRIRARTGSGPRKTGSFLRQSALEECGLMLSRTC